MSRYQIYDDSPEIPMTESTITLSKETIKILRNFSEINDKGLMIQQGHRQRTQNNFKSIVGYMEIKESFPKQFGIWDLNEFLNVFSLFKEPTLDFSSEGVVVFKDGDRELNFYECDHESVLTPPTSFPEPDFVTRFPVSKSTISSIVRFKKKLELNTLTLRSSGDRVVEINVFYDDLIGTSNGHIYKQFLKIDRPVEKFHHKIHLEHFKIIPDDYECFVSKKPSCTKWTSSIGTYYLSGESD